MTGRMPLGVRRGASSPLWMVLVAAGIAVPRIRAASAAAGPDGVRAGFSASVVRDPEIGWDLIGLSYRDPARPDQDIAAWIAPAAGANLFRLMIGGTDLLRHPASLRDLPGAGYGNPILYPTPNRIRGGVFRFRGREFRFNDPGRTGNFIHGLVNRIAWSYEPPRAAADGADVRMSLEIEPGHPIHAKFPYRHTLSMTYSLARDGVRCAFRVENRDAEALPFGLGFHPYFLYLGERKDTRLCVPARRRMQATPDLLPTGVLEPLDGAAFDLREPRSLEGVVLDDVFWGLEPARPAWFESASAGIRVTFQATDAFTHMVVYSPPGRPFFCVENQTCSTDAHNLHERGLTEEAHLLVVPPGGKAEGSVTYRIERAGAR
ncbi:MAG: aldose 1-epimerase [Planctomycetes bacterium]|nr:aldose 1-epimerase [Planctomycetota bacterium]